MTSLTDKARQRAENPETVRRRLPREARERLIVEGAIRFFAEVGFGGQTRELAKRLGITQPLLYRYFPTKEDLIDRVYAEVYLGRWKPEWQAWLADRSQAIDQRLKRFYKDYQRTILTYEWVRMFLFAGLTGKGVTINQRYLARVRALIFDTICTELRHHAGLPGPEAQPITEAEIELVYSLHAAVFYLGQRKFVYHLPVPEDFDAVIDMDVDNFLRGVDATLRTLLGR